MKKHNILIALLVGDGFVDKRGSIGFHHGIAQKNWLLHKVGILTSFGFTVRIRETQRESYGKVREFITANTLVTEYGKDLRKLLYHNDEKKIPFDIVSNFGFEEWAIIYQDDGRQNIISHYNSLINGEKARIECEPFVNRYCICSQGFDTNSNENLQSSLLSIGVQSSLYKVKGGYGKQIAISRAKAKVTFYEGIRSYIVKDLQYKISAKPCLSY